MRCSHATGGGTSAAWAHLWIWLVIATNTPEENSAAVAKAPSTDPVSVQSPQTIKKLPPSRLEPLVSMKSCRQMASGSTWCSRNVRTSERPMIGVSGENQVSKNQCPAPDTRSAATKPATSASPDSAQLAFIGSQSRQKSATAVTGKASEQAISTRRTVGGVLASAGRSCCVGMSFGSVMVRETSERRVPAAGGRGFE